MKRRKVVRRSFYYDGQVATLYDDGSETARASRDYSYKALKKFEMLAYDEEVLVTVIFLKESGPSVFMREALPCQ